MCLPLQDGQTPRPLQEKATTNPVRHVMQTARAKPKQRSESPVAFRGLAARTVAAAAPARNWRRRQRAATIGMGRVSIL
jgi:hypothetical protein